jgi:iron complex transport system ATP-binding protein
MYIVNHLSFSYPNKHVLHDITVQFPENQITAIIGPNGCGKSTLLKHLSKSIHSKDSITLNGEPLESINSSRFAKSVAILSQMHDAMIDDFLVKDIVLMGRYPHKTRFGNYTKQDVSIAQSYMEHIGITHLADEQVQHLSGGELQRAFIAKALTQEPTILLLDEPTNHLDLKYKLALMKELQHFEGTVIVVLHDLQLAATYCDNIVLMNKGRIIQTGTPQEVLTPGLLAPVFEIPFTTTLENGIYRIQY